MVLQTIVNVVAIFGGCISSYSLIRNMRHSDLKERRDKLWNGATNFLNDLEQMRSSYSYYGSSKKAVQENLYESLKEAIYKVVSLSTKKKHVSHEECVNKVRIFSSQSSQPCFDSFIVAIFEEWKYKKSHVKEFSVEMFLVFLESVQSQLDTVMSSGDISSKDKRSYALSILSSLTKEELYALMLFGTHSENKGVEEAFKESAISPYLLPNRYQADVVSSIILARYYQ